MTGRALAGARGGWTPAFLVVMMGPMRTSTLHRAVAASAALLVLAGCTSGGSGPSDRPATAGPVTSPAPTQPPPSAGGSAFVDYASGDSAGVTITTAADAAMLKGAPSDFVAFVVAELDRKPDARDAGCTEKTQIIVSRVDAGGWAAGARSIPMCGGSGALWARVDGQWKTVYSGESLPPCATVAEYKVPERVQSDCVKEGEDPAEPMTGIAPSPTPSAP